MSGLSSKADHLRGCLIRTPQDSRIMTGPALRPALRRGASGRVRKSGGSARGAPGAAAGARQPLAYWWYVCGCRAPAGAVGARENPSDLRTGPLALALVGEELRRLDPGVWRVRE